MAKRKNPLKDLDSFLKQEATSFVNPEKITPPKEDRQGSIEEIKKSSATPEPPKKEQHIPSSDEIIAELKALAGQEGANFRSEFYSIIKKTLEQLETPSAADKMLINTIIYLNDQTNWKDNIKNYWQQK